MSVRVVGIEPRAAQIAEMRVALVALHVVAAHDLLGRRTACRTWRGVKLDVVEGRLLFCGELAWIARPAARVLAMPTREADPAEGKGTLAAYC